MTPDPKLLQAWRDGDHDKLQAWEREAETREYGGDGQDPEPGALSAYIAARDEAWRAYQDENQIPEEEREENARDQVSAENAYIEERESQ